MRRQAQHKSGKEPLACHTDPPRTENGSPHLQAPVSVSIKYRHAGRRRQKVGRFFVLVFVGVRGYARVQERKKQESTRHSRCLPCAYLFFLSLYAFFYCFIIPCGLTPFSTVWREPAFADSRILFVSYRKNDLSYVLSALKYRVRLLCSLDR